MTGRGEAPRMTRFLAVACVYAAAGFLIYANVLLHGIFLFDDFEYVVGNALIESLSRLSMSDTRQVGYLSFALNYALGGDDPRGYHAVNVLIHVLNSAGVFLLVRSLLSLLTPGGRREGGGQNDHLPFLAGLIFLVHPLATQSVSYITQRFTALATLFYLGSVIAYLAARVRMEASTDSGRPNAWYALSLASAFLAMKTKEIAFTIPFCIGMFELLLFRTSAAGRRRFLYLVPFAALLVIIPLSLLGPELGLMGAGEGIAEITRKEKIYDLVERSPYEYLLTQFRVLVIYLRLFFLPVNQQVVYDLKASRSLLDPRVLLSAFLLLAVAWNAVRIWRRSAAGERGEPWHGRLAALGIAWFFLTISVESSVIPIKDLIFEHRTYLPGVGVSVVFAVILTGVAGRLLPARLCGMRTALIGLIVFSLAASTVARNRLWVDELLFWDDVVRKNPGKAIGYHNRGNAYAKTGDYDRALKDFDTTIGFFPGKPEESGEFEGADFTPSNMAKTFFNRGTLYLDMGDQGRAARDFERARQLVNSVSETGRAMQLADVYAKKGAYRHAIEVYNEVLQWEPENIDALNDRANAYSQGGRYREAIRDFSRIVTLQPDYVLAYHNRGIAYAWSGDTKRAVEDFTKACGMGFQPACESIEVAKQGRK